MNRVQAYRITVSGAVASFDGLFIELPTYDQIAEAIEQAACDREHDVSGPDDEVVRDEITALRKLRAIARIAKDDGLPLEGEFRVEVAGCEVGTISVKREHVWDVG